MIVVKPRSITLEVMTDRIRQTNDSMNAFIKAPRRPVMLIILDGFGVNPGKRHNAVEAAHTPNLDAYFASYPHTLLQASGPSVGLPDGQMGNSEVGHMALGSGNIINQDIVMINDAIDDDSFYANAALHKAVSQSVLNNRPVHLIGLVSDGGVHSHIDHLLALIQLCKRNGAKPLLHMITDGRDTAPKSALTYLPEIETRLHEAGGAIASIIGRYYAMDRDNRWDRTELAWRTYILGKGQKAQSAETAICSAYAAGDNDEFIRPILLPKFDVMRADDEVIMFNFRKDRPQQIVAALGSKEFKGFDRGQMIHPNITCMMPYDKQLEMPYAFEPDKPKICLAQILSDAGLKQFHCSETEKYPHVTYFFNGGRTNPFSGETQLLIPSPQVATYDQKPEMSAREISEAVINAINSECYDFIVVNFANGDMVGHTAVEDAVIEAVEVLDEQVGKLIQTAVSNDYSIVLTADHGNCEELVDPTTGMPQTQHTMYPVPCMIIDKSSWQLSCSGGLANVAPTVLQLMGIDIPHNLMEKSLLIKEKGFPVHTRNLDFVA